MATINDLSALLVSETNIKSKIKNISNISSVVNTCTKNFNDFSTNINDFSSNFNDFSTEITDLSNHFTDLSTNINDFSTNVTDLSSTNNVIINIGNSVDKMNSKLEKSDSKSKKAAKGLLALVKSGVSLKKVSKGTDMIDKYINAGNGLARINDGLQTQMELQNKVNAAATRSSISYNDMAGAVSDIGKLDTFGSNDETIAFTELMQKSLTLEGSDQSLSDVSSAMSDNVIKADEFSSLTSGAPIIKEALSSFTGKSGEELQKMADQGLITAQILKNAMFAASSDINTQFAEQPKTFANIWTQIKNSAMNALSPLMELVSNIINSPGIQAAINVIINALGFASGVLSNIISFITDNWSIIQPILIAIGAYLLYLGVLAFTQFMRATIAELASVAPLLIIIAVIAVVIGVLQYLGVSFEDIFGFIGGVVGVTIAGIWNLILGLFDFILGIINLLVNPFINFANFFGNLFTNPISSIIYLFQGMADSVLGIIEKVASALDMVFGTKMAETVSGWRTGLKDMADKAVEKYAPDENYKKIMDNLDLSTESLGLSRMDYGDAWDQGTNTGKDLYNGMSSALGSLSQPDKEPDYSQFGNDDIGTPKNPVVTEGTGSGGSVKVDMKDEDLSYLREMAERDYIANIATNTLAPNISVSFGDVHETADVNELFGRIQTILKEQIAIAPEGVY
jgi:tape measure domain-containing protein